MADTEAVTQDVFKKRYRTTKVLSVGEGGSFNRGELVDEEQIPASILAELAAQENSPLEYVDTVKWNPTGHGGQGAWEAVLAPIEDPTPGTPEAAAKAAAEAEAAAKAAAAAPAPTGKQPAGPPKSTATPSTSSDDQAKGGQS